MVKADENVCMSIEPGEPYPWDLLRRTCFLLVAFLCLGIPLAITGPTLLDLKDLYNVSVSTISFIFMIGSIGSLVGCFGVGILMDKLSRYRYLITALQLILLGIGVTLFPLFPHVSGLFTVAFFAGLGSGAFDAGGQVLLLDIWRGRESGPYMHALHFFFGIGAFLAPMIARPFLTNTEDVDLHGNIAPTPPINISGNSYVNKTLELDYHQIDPDSDLTADVGMLISEESIYDIKFLFPLVGSFPIIISIAFVSYFIIDERNGKSSKGEETEQSIDKKAEDKATPLLGVKLVILIVMMIFFFLYVGQEVAFGTFISVFAVECKLGLSRQQGSDLTAVFWGTFAGARGLAVPAAILLPPNVIMTVSFIASLGGALVLSIYGETSVHVLFACTALLGFGMASIYATGLLWLEKRMVITNKIGAAMAISSSLGAKIFPVLVGQTVEKYPMSFMYIILGTSTGCTMLFILNSLLALQIDKTMKTPENNLEEHHNLSTTAQGDIIEIENAGEDLKTLNKDCLNNRD